MPSRAVSIGVSAALVVAWAGVRLVVFDYTIFPLTYLLPLLVCVWTRDRVALWLMAASFAALHVAKLFWILPDQALTSTETWLHLTATVANLAIGGLVVDMIVRLRRRLETSLELISRQAAELSAQGEELAQQNEELREQTEELESQATELSEQGEELASQNEEMLSQSEEISALNAALEQREHLVETLLEAARSAATDEQALQHIVEASCRLFGEVGAAAAVYEVTPTALRLQVLACGGSAVTSGEGAAGEDGFASLVLAENRTAALNDTSLRPDLPLPALAGAAPIRAVLGTPVRVRSETVGVFVVYSAHEHDWTEEQFHLAEWLGDQCGHVLHLLGAQQALREADQRKSEFLATLSHELRNPLAPMRFALALVAQGRTQDGNALRILERQFQQLVRLVDDLLDATRLSSNKIQLRKSRCDLVLLVQHAAEALKPDIESAGHAFILTLPPQPVWLEADEERVVQVVTNVLTNAIRYTPAGGRVAMTVAASHDEALLTVADSGVGMHPDDLSRVFDMFTQVGGPGSGGLGIGLAIVRGLVELHGGRVEVRSDGIGHGSEFRISLPLGAAPHEEAGTLNVVSCAAPVDTKRVLVVDDNVDAAELLATVLEIHGHTVWKAHEAAGALALAHQHAPEVALLDIGLPGVDGYELARRLRLGAATRHMRLVAVTGWGQDGDRAKARAAGFDAHLTKPAAPDQILSALSAGSAQVGLA